MRAHGLHGRYVSFDEPSPFAPIFHPGADRMGPLRSECALAWLLPNWNGGDCPRHCARVSNFDSAFVLPHLLERADEDLEVHPSDN